MLKKEHRLRKRKHFSYIYKKGNKISSNHITMTYIKSKYPCYRVGFSVSKKIGKANIRNKVKRRMREIVRDNPNIKNYYNYVLIAREGIENLGFLELKAQIESLFKRVI